MKKNALLSFLFACLLCSSVSCKKSVTVYSDYKDFLDNSHLTLGKVNTVANFFPVDTVIFNANQTITEKWRGYTTTYPFSIHITTTVNTYGDTSRTTKLFCTDGGPAGAVFFRQKLADTLLAGYADDTSSVFSGQFSFSDYVLSHH